MSEKPTIIILHESMWQSLLSDAGTFAMCAALIAPGIWLDSAAMQWIGAIMFMIAVLSKASMKGKRKTLAEARAFLDDLERAGQP